MSLLQFAVHLIGLMLPAFALAIFMPWAGRWVMGAGSKPWWPGFGWHALVGCAVLWTGLLLQGHDGRMATYMALVLISASLEWLRQRGWRR